MEAAFAEIPEPARSGLPSLRGLFPDNLDHEGARAVRFEDDAEPPSDAPRPPVRIAPTHHLDHR